MKDIKIVKSATARANEEKSWRMWCVCVFACVTGIFGRSRMENLMKLIEGNGSYLKGGKKFIFLCSVLIS